MTDTALENAKAQQKQLSERKRELEAELRRVSTDLSDTESFIDRWYRFAGVAPVENGETTGEQPHPIQGEPKVQLTKNSKKEDVAVEVRKIIEERKQPILRKDLMPVLLERGFKIEGSDPDMVLSTMLWRAGEGAGVVRLKRGGYWLKERPWPDAGYDPDAPVTPLDMLNIEVDVPGEAARQIQEESARGTKDT